MKGNTRQGLEPPRQPLLTTTATITTKQVQSLVLPCGALSRKLATNCQHKQLSKQLSKQLRTPRSEATIASVALAIAHQITAQNACTFWVNWLRL